MRHWLGLSDHAIYEAIAVLSVLFSGMLTVAVPFAVARHRRRQFGPRWTANRVVRSGECLIHLVAGPWQERVICLECVPAVGAILRIDPADVVDRIVVASEYQVVQVNRGGRQAIASWCRGG